MGSVSGLESRQDLLADRYFKILISNPANTQAAGKLWEIYAAAGQTEALIQKTRHLCEDDPLARLPLADFLIRAGESEEALEALQHLPWETLDARILIEAGKRWNQLGEVSKAVEVWELAAEKSPDDFHLLKDLAAACLSAGETETARRSLSRLAEGGSPSERLAAMETMLRVHEASGAFAEAALVAREILDLLEPGHWKAAEAAQRAIALAQRAGTLESLEKAWEEAAEHNPAVLIRLASLAAFRGEGQARLAWLEAACEAFPTDRTLLRERGKVELSLAKFDAAVRSFRRLLDTESGDTDARLALAEALALQGKEEEAEAQVDALSNALGGLPESRKLEILLRLNLQVPAEKLLRRVFDEQPGSVPAALELAAFLRDAGRPAEAVSILDRLDLEPLDATARAAAQAQVAHFLKEAQWLGASEDWARRARNSDPATHTHTLLLADILESRGDHPGALELLQATAPLDGGLPHEDLDRRLLVAMQKRDGQENASLRNTGPKQFSEALVHRAYSVESADAWLRAARWCAWVGETSLAAECLRAGLAADPSASQLLTPLATELERMGDPEGAIHAYARLKTLRPQDTAAIDRKIARLEIVRGNPEAAEATLLSQLSEAGRDWSLLRELALAREAAGNYFGALDVWIEVFDTAPPTERPAVLRSLLATFSRLSLIGRALAFLDSASPGFPEGPLRREFLRVSEDFARQHQGTEAWTEAVAARLEANPDSLVRTWSPQDPAQASSQNVMPGPSRQEMAAAYQEAAASGEWGRAADLARRLAQPPEGTLEDSLAFARALEAGGQQKEALDAWRHLSARYARSREALLAAAEALGRLGDTEGQLSGWRAASRLGAIPSHLLLELGRSAAQKGDRLQALTDFKAVLAATPPTPSPPPDLIPPLLPSRLRPEDLGLDSMSESDPQGCRLLAFAAAGALLADSPEKMREIASLGAASPQETARVLWAAGEPVRAMEALKSDNADPTALFCLAMEAGLPDLAPFPRDAGDTPTRWLEFLAATKAMVKAGWRPESSKMDLWLADAPPFVRLRFANLLSESGAIRLAVEVGVPEGLTAEAASEAWYRLAGWQLGLRQPDAAAASLDRVLSLTAPPQSLEGIAASAIRARWLLESPENREALRERILAESDRDGPSAAGVLFAALEGRRSAFVSQARDWMQTWPSGPEAALLRARREGAQLEVWHLGIEARDLYRTALEQFDPFPGFTQGAPLRRPIKRILEDAIVTSRLDEADPALAEFLANEWVARGAQADQLGSAGTRAAGQGRIGIARMLFSKAFSLAPGSISWWTNLISLAPFPDGFPEILPAWFLAASPRERSWIPADTLLQLVTLLIEAGREPEALEILQAEGVQDLDERLALKRAALQIAMGNPSAAVDAWRESFNPSQASEIPPDTKHPEKSEEPQESEESEDEHLERMRARWLQGDPLAAEALVRIAADRGDRTLVESTIRELLASGRSSRASRQDLAKWLLGKNHPDWAVEVYADLDREGLTDHALVLSYAEALWKSGRRSEAIDIASAVRRSAAIDPNLHVALAAFFVSVDRPDQAVRSLDDESLPPAAARRVAPLRSPVARQFLERGRIREASEQLALAAESPGTIDPGILLLFLESTGQFHPSDPLNLPFALHSHDQHALLREAATQALAKNRPDDTLTILAVSATFAMTPEAIALATSAQGASKECLEKFWHLVARSPLAERRHLAESILNAH